MNYFPSKVWKISLHIVICNFLFCYTFGVFNTCAANVSATLGWGELESTYTTLFSSFVPLGALIGATVAGPLMSRLGRRHSVMLTDLIMMVSSGITCVLFTPAFAIGRLLSGFAAGLFMTIPPNYVNEITPDEMLPKTGPLVQISANVGLLFAYSFGLPLPTSDYNSESFNYWWIFMFAFPGFVALYQFWYFWAVCKYDSALWLLNQGKKEESLKSLAQVYTEDGVNEGLLRFSVLGGGAEEENRMDVGFKELIGEKKYRKMVRIGVALAILQQVSGINAGIFYSTSIFMNIGGSVFMARVYTVVTSFIFLLAGLGSIPLLAYYGRATLLISGQILLAIDLCMLGIGIIIGNIPEIVLVCGVVLIFVFFVYSLGSTLWLYLGESCYDKVLGISASVNLLFVLFVTVGFPITVEKFGIQYPFLFFGVCMAIGAMYCKWELVETKGKSKLEVMKLIIG